MRSASFKPRSPSPSAASKPTASGSGTAYRPEAARRAQQTNVAIVEDRLRQGRFDRAGSRSARNGPATDLFYTAATRQPSSTRPGRPARLHHHRGRCAGHGCRSSAISEHAIHRRLGLQLACAALARYGRVSLSRACDKPDPDPGALGSTLLSAVRILAHRIARLDVGARIPGSVCAVSAGPRERWHAAFRADGRGGSRVSIRFSSSCRQPS